MEKNKYLLSCDLGSEYIKLILFESTNKEINPIKHHIKKVVESDLNNKHPERCLCNSLTEAIEEMSLPELDDVYVSINHDKLISNTITHKENFHKPVIVTNEIKDSVNNVDDFLNKNEDLLYLKFNKYVIDGKMEVSNPLQMEVKSLEIENFYVKILKKYTEDIDNLFSKVPITPTSIIPGIVAEGELLVSNQDKNFGACLIDVGYKTSDVIIYSNNNIKNCFTINFGIGDFIESIASFLYLKYKDAYYIFKENADLQKLDSDAPISFINIYGVKKVIKVGFFNKILEDLVKQLMTNIKRVFEYNKINPHNIILCGGLSKIKGVNNTTSQVFNMNRVKIAKLEQKKTPELSDTNWATALGMVKLSIEEDKKIENNSVMNVIYNIKTFIENILK